MEGCCQNFANYGVPNSENSILGMCAMGFAVLKELIPGSQHTGGNVCLCDLLVLHSHKLAIWVWLCDLCWWSTYRYHTPHIPKPRIAHSGRWFFLFFGNFPPLSFLCRWSEMWFFFIFGEVQMCLFKKEYSDPHGLYRFLVMDIAEDPTQVSDLWLVSPEGVKVIQCYHGWYQC